jgi:hypothetical protein
MANGDAESPYELWQSDLKSDTPFIVCSMFTDSYREKAERLAASVRKFGLAHALFKLSTVHRSISPKGSDDLAFTKPLFIDHMLRRFNRPILYVDGDCEFRDKPDLIWVLRKENIDFAIYNWFSDVMNDAWLPYEALSARTKTGAPRYWRYSHSNDDFSPFQLCCSGAVQYWADSDRAFALLEAWQQNVAKFARSPDDESLQLAFNLAQYGKPDLKYFWLPKEYARYSFWIYVQPVIDHPDLPTYADPAHFELLGGKTFDAPRIFVGLQKARPLPRACVIDAEENLVLLRLPNGNFMPIVRVPVPLFV